MYGFVPALYGAPATWATASVGRARTARPMDASRGLVARRKPFHHQSDAIPLCQRRDGKESMHILWVVIIGALAGFVAKLISPSPNNPQGFILTTVLGIVGSIVASYLGQAVGLYGPDQSAGFIGAIIGAVIILAIWHFIDRRRQPN